MKGEPGSRGQRVQLGLWDRPAGTLLTFVLLSVGSELAGSHREVVTVNMMSVSFMSTCSVDPNGSENTSYVAILQS